MTKDKKALPKKPNGITIDSNILAKMLGYEKRLFSVIFEIVAQNNNLQLWHSNSCYWIGFRQFQILCENIPISDKQKYEIACYFIGRHNRHKIRKNIKKECKKILL